MSQLTILLLSSRIVFYNAKIKDDLIITFIWSDTIEMYI